FWLTALVAAVLVAACPGGAGARGVTTVTVGCATLQAALDGSVSGDTIILSGACTNQSFTLPAHTVTLQGDGGGDDGFNGNASSSQPILSGGGVDATTIKGLFFKSAS